MLVSKAALSRVNLVGLLACLADDGGELGLVLCYVRKQKKNQTQSRRRERYCVIIEKSDGKTVFEGSCRTYGLG